MFLVQKLKMEGMHFEPLNRSKKVSASDFFILKTRSHYGGNDKTNQNFFHHSVSSWDGFCTQL